MATKYTRRRFLTNLSMAGGAIVLRAAPAFAEEPLETTSLRFAKSPSICLAPQDIADELLRAEGFKDIRYLPSNQFQEALAAGELDLGLEYASKYVEAVERRLDEHPEKCASGVRRSSIRSGRSRRGWEQPTF